MPATINRAMQALTIKKKPQFVTWVPAGFKVGINSPPMRTPSAWPMSDMSRSVSTLINNTVVCEKFKQICRNQRYIGGMSGYDVWTAVGGIEQSILESSVEGIIHQISQYEHCMSSKTEIDEIKTKLSEPPTPLGKF